MANPIKPHTFATNNLTQSIDRVIPPLFSLPYELLKTIAEYVATAKTPKQAAVNAIQWGRVCVLSQRTTQEPGIASVINQAKRQKDLDEALLILWSFLAPKMTGVPTMTAAPAIRGWMADPNNARFLDTIDSVGLVERRLKVIPPEINTLRNLRTLQLEKNQITQIYPETFAGCRALRFLSLHNNRITQIAPQAFAGCQALTLLSLEYNQMAKIDPQAFAGCPTLQTLRLNNNRITQIDPQTFAGYLALEVLDLSNNQIVQIDPQTFAGCRALQVLILNNNQLTQIAPQAFAGCQALNTLYINDNRITQIGPQAFAGCQALKTLYINDNRITQIAPQTFAGCQALKTLHFNHNPLLCMLVPHDGNCLARFNAFSAYVCKSELAAFYKAVSEGRWTRPEIVEHLKQLEDRNLIYELVYWEAVAAAEKEKRRFSTDGDHQWGEHHVCDDMPMFFRALTRAVQAKFERLLPEQKCVVRDRISDAIAQGNMSLTAGDFIWNALWFIDAMAGV